jgi:hypothetical protein
MCCTVRAALKPPVLNAYFPPGTKMDATYVVEAEIAIGVGKFTCTHPAVEEELGEMLTEVIEEPTGK